MRLRPTGAVGEYEVFDGHDPVGVVRKRVERYNLRRPVTVVTWLAYVDGRGRLPGHHTTRRDAVAAVEAAHQAAPAPGGAA